MGHGSKCLRPKQTISNDKPFGLVYEVVLTFGLCQGSNKAGSYEVLVPAGGICCL
jgi:hypothetical protein